MQPHDVQVLLYKIYNSAYQFGNAGAALHPETWNTSSRKRALFYLQANSLRAMVDALQKPWNGFYKSPRDGELGRETLLALNKLVPEADSFTKALQDTAGASVAADYQKSAADLADLERQLEAYVSGLEAQAPASAENVEAKSQPAQPAQPESGAKANPSGPAPASAAPSPVAAPSRAVQSSPPQAVPSSEAGGGERPTPASTASTGTALPPTSAQPASPPVAMPPTEVQALLYKIYGAG